MLKRLRNVERVLRRMRHTIVPSRKYRGRSLSRSVLEENSTVLRFGAKTMRWVFQDADTRDFYERSILPWAFPLVRIERRDLSADFTVGAYLLYDETVTGSFADLPGRKFLLAGEVETRYPRIDRTLSFVQGPQPGDDPAYIRYAPILCSWVPPLNPVKSRKCSVVDSGRYPWRVELINRLCRQIGDVEIFGKLSGKTLPGYHLPGASLAAEGKCVGIQDFCFYLSLERAVADDYLTEKFSDAVLCNAVPIYYGAPNLSLYAYPEASISVADVDKIDWSNWRREYDRRLPALRAQKEFFRTKLNIFSYFHAVTDDPSLLDRRRPITIAV
ncbi:MAG: glycosyltransferase family 10 domain-containing protein [Phycisphaerae bacterium]